MFEAVSVIYEGNSTSMNGWLIQHLRASFTFSTISEVQHNTFRHIAQLRKNQTVMHKQWRGVSCPHIIDSISPQFLPHESKLKISADSLPFDSQKILSRLSLNLQKDGVRESRRNIRWKRWLSHIFKFLWNDSRWTLVLSPVCRPARISTEFSRRLHRYPL